LFSVKNGFLGFTYSGGVDIGNVTEGISTRWKAIGKTIGVVVTNAVAGTAATQVKTDWYESLEKPSFQPPAWVFPVAWTALYTDIATVTGLSLADLAEKENDEDYNSLRTALIANAVLNFGWSFLFFTAKKPAIATVEAGALACSSWDLARRAMKVNRNRGLWLLPYGGWCTFATVLTGALWWLNRD